MDSIRQATVDDADSISELVSALVSQEIAPTLGEGGLETLLASMDVASTRQRILAGWPHFCLFDGAGLAGILVVTPPTHLFHLFVRAEVQRSGIARRLLAVADEHTRHEAPSRLMTVNASLNAVAAYRRFGFVPDGPVVDRDGVRFQPMVRREMGNLESQDTTTTDE